MSIKRAFLAATAALMVPGLAMAQVTATFPTTVDFSNNATDSVTATVTCNSGNPLTQSADISEAGGVTFVVQELDIANADFTCDVTMDGLAEGYTTSTVCSFVGGSTLTEENSCEFVAVPEISNLFVFKEWVNDNPDVSETFAFQFECTNASLTTDGTSTTLSGTFQGNGEGANVASFYPAPGLTSVCTATEVLDSLDSAVESDQGCAGPYSFTIGSGDQECTITNTVFYEGIPSLNQYGLAIMALLMLGVGMVGFRRFV